MITTIDVQTGEVITRELTAAERDAIVPYDPKPDRIAAIKLRLAQIDMERIRPMSAIIDGTAIQFDRDKFTSLAGEAATLRAELVTL